MQTQLPLTVYFDGSCALCRLEIAHFKSRRGGERLNLVDASDVNADTGPGLDRRTARSRLHVREPDGRLRSGGDAFAAIWERLPLYRPAAGAARLPGASLLIEMAYCASQPYRPIAAKLVRQIRG